MHLNAKVALLLLGMLVGGVAGYLTMPKPIEIVRIGVTPQRPPGNAELQPAVPMQQTTLSPTDGGLLSDLGGRILIFAAVGGIFGLLAGFAGGRL